MNRKLRVLLVQLPVPNNPSLNTPLAAGYLKAYAHAQGLLERVEIDLLPRQLADGAGDAMLVDEIVARRPDVLGVSLYTWNSERSLAVVQRVKEHAPAMRIVVGGPEVQKDNLWVLDHPSVDVAVIGEGEQTFVELLRLWAQGASPDDMHIPLMSAEAGGALATVPGIAYRFDGEMRFTPDRVPLGDLSALPSPYLLGYLDVPAGGMLMVEVSRWCPYSCSFCLYGRNMGIKLGNRYFGLERVLAEIRWARERGIERVHFVEANLNLVPLFWPLMRALADLNADRRMTFYAELRGEHLTEEVVSALDRANVRFVEIGLQTANQAALKASLRRTDLRKWAAGARRLYAHGIEVYLDVILGLPDDDEAGVAETLDFIRREDLGPYDIFTLQVLPGTAVRQQAEQYGLSFQERPPYYVLGTERLSYSDLRRLRRDLKRGVSLPPDAVEGMPEPRSGALAPLAVRSLDGVAIERLWMLPVHQALIEDCVVQRLATHVDVVIKAEALGTHTPLLVIAIARNPATIFDIYIHCESAPPAQTLLQWRAALPYQPGYLDRVAVYRGAAPADGHTRVSPRCFLVLPWTSTVDAADYHSIAEIIWRFELGEGDLVPLNAWRGAGGAGIALDFAPGSTERYRSGVLAEVAQWERDTGRRVWHTGVLEEHPPKVFE